MKSSRRQKVLNRRALAARDSGVSGLMAIQRYMLRGKYTMTADGLWFSHPAVRRAMRHALASK